MHLAPCKKESHEAPEVLGLDLCRLGRSRLADAGSDHTGSEISSTPEYSSWLREVRTSHISPYLPISPRSSTPTEYSSRLREARISHISPYLPVSPGSTSAPDWLYSFLARRRNVH